MCVGAAKRSICGFMGIPPQVAAIETSGRYFAKSSRFLKSAQLPWAKTSALCKMKLLSVKKKSKQLFCVVQAQPGQLCLLKVAELLALWVQQFQQAFKI
jgi:hypothetical protein